MYRSILSGLLALTIFVGAGCDIYQNTASVRAEMSGWIDYMHMAKWNGRWVIVNVLWELKPQN